MEDALIAHQVELEKLYNKNQTIGRIRAEFTDCKEFSFTDYMKQQGIPLQFGTDLLVQMALHKRCKLEVLIGLLRHHTNNAQATTDLILKCAEADLVDWSPDLKIFIVKFTISDDVQQEIDRYQFPLPMVVPPKEITNNEQTGYMLGTGSLILKNNHHDDDICLDHINRMNRVKFTINANTAMMVKNKWRNLDKVKEGETREDLERRQRAFEKYDRTAKDVMATLQKHSEDFHLTHKYDKRGRTYCQGYHVTYQGNSWCKAVIELTDQELVQ